MGRRIAVRPKVRKYVTGTIPCSVMEYYEWFKMDRQIENKLYELIVYNVRTKDLETIKLRPREVNLFEQHIDKFKEVLQTADGKVWEKGDFKKLVKELKII